MRISVDRRDKGYRWDATDANKFKVLLDGEPAKNVVTADEEEGIVKRFVMGEDGRPQVSADGKHLNIEVVQGKVEIVVAKGADGESLRDPKVKVERNKDGLVEVLVYSRMQPGVVRRITLDEQTIAQRGMNIDKAVSIFAGQAAEELIARNAEMFDPSDVAKMATAEFERLKVLESSPTVH